MLSGQTNFLFPGGREREGYIQDTAWEEKCWAHGQGKRGIREMYPFKPLEPSFRGITLSVTAVGEDELVSGMKMCISFLPPRFRSPFVYKTSP